MDHHGQNQDYRKVRHRASLARPPARKQARFI
jgi:hypothetical protein